MSLRKRGKTERAGKPALFFCSWERRWPLLTLKALLPSGSQRHFVLSAQGAPGLTTTPPAGRAVWLSGSARASRPVQKHFGTNGANFCRAHSHTSHHMVFPIQRSKAGFCRPMNLPIIFLGVPSGTMFMLKKFTPAGRGTLKKFFQK